MEKRFKFVLVYHDRPEKKILVYPVPDTFFWRIDVDMNCLVLRHDPKYREHYPLANVVSVVFINESH